MQFIKKYIFWIINPIIIFLIAGGIFLIRESAYENFWYAVVDGVFIAGALYFIFGLFVYLSNEKIMSALTYGMRQIARSFRKNPEKDVEYHEYVHDGREKKTFGRYLIIGLVLIAISLIILFTQ